MPYLRKLSVTDIPSDSNFLFSMFPELANGINTTRLKQYRAIWLLELEKFLRRLRVLSMKMDRGSYSLITKIRNVTETKHEKSDSLVISEAKDISIISKSAELKKEESVEDWKKEEQRLIIEIAKNPKNSSLYEVLGDLYIKMGNFSDAKESYEAAIELNPTKEDLIKKHSQAIEKVL